MSRLYRSPAVRSRRRPARSAFLVTVALYPLGLAAGGLDGAGPVLELEFEGNLDCTAESGQACRPVGSVPFVPGKRGLCASFDGHGWIDTGYQQQRLGDAFTVECWVSPDERQSPYADVFGNHVSEGLGFVLQQSASSTNEFLAAYGAGGGRWVLTEAVPLVAGRWQHVALVRTREDLRLYVNGILVTQKRDAAPARASPMPVAVGLGYTDRARCFRGRIDDFRIWDRAVTEFDHAGIDPSEAHATQERYLTATPRPAAGASTESWTLATDDTRVTIGVTAESRVVLTDLSCPTSGRNWVTRPVAFGFLSEVEVGGHTRAVDWRLVDARAEHADGRRLTLRFACDDPALEITSEWVALRGPGPIRHIMAVRNRSTQPVTIGEQPTFDLDLTGADALWCFHSDGGTPDPVGVYRHPLATQPAGRRHTVRTAPTGEFIPLVVLDADGREGVYMGLEWSSCRIEVVSLSGGASPEVRVRGGNIADLRAELGPGDLLELRPGFLGAYRGDLDDAGNRLRRWQLRFCVPDVVRLDPGYPKVQWNAFGATGKAPGSWDPVEEKLYPLIDDIAPLGFEELMIDVGWWQGGEPDPEPDDWPGGMRKAADYAREKGLRFGLYWTDDQDMASPAGRRKRADRIRRLFQEHGADLWRSDCTRGAVLDSSFAATRGFYDMLDSLNREIPGFQWENCCGGGRIKDYGAMRRAVKIFNSDTYSALHVRQAFYDSSHAFHPIQLEGHLGSSDGLYRPRGAAGIRYAFRSTSLGAPEWFLDAPSGGNGTEPWTREERDALRACVQTYKTAIRPLQRRGDLYHVLPRPDGAHRDGIEYHDPAAGDGVVYVFQPSREQAAGTIRFRGLDPDRTYRIRFEDGTHPPCVKPGSELMSDGLAVTLRGDEVSELIFFEVQD